MKVTNIYGYTIEHGFELGEDRTDINRQLQDSNL